MLRNFLVASAFITLLSILSVGFIISQRSAEKVLERVQETIRESGR